MRILHIINSLSTGGAEKLIVETLPLYAAQGIEVDVLLLNGTERPLYKDLQDKKCCNIYSLGKISVYNPLLILKMIPYIRKYDVIHVHLFPAQYFAIIARWLAHCKKPIIFTEHNTSNRRIKNSLFHFFERMIYKRYHKIICITEEVRVVLKKHVPGAAHKMLVIENGINIDKMQSAGKMQKPDIHHSLKENDFVLIQVAAFRHQKDQPTLIRASLHLPPEIKILLVGDGPLREKCEKLVTELKLNDRVLFLGLRNDVPELLNTADAVVLSSKYEGLSLSSIEGMASGKPFIASDVPGLAQVVGGAGVLFPAGNYKILAETVIKLMSDQNYYQEISDRCHERATHFTIQRMVQDHIKLYKQIIYPT